MIVKTSMAKERSFNLLKTEMRERAPKENQYFLYRSALKKALKGNFARVRVYLDGGIGVQLANDFYITQGKTQRGKKFFQIGCKRFVGVNRTRLIRWAMAAK